MAKRAVASDARETRRSQAKRLPARSKAPLSRRQKTAAAGSENDLREIYRDSPIPALALNGAYTIKGFNPAVCELLNTSARGLSQQGFRGFVREEDRRLLSQHVARAKTRGATETFQITLRPRAAEPLPVQIWLRHDKAKRVSELWLIDLRTARVENEQARRLAESERAAREESAAKDRFIAVLSHELRAPLTPVLAVASAFRSKELPQDLKEAFEMIERNIGAEARLIDDLLDVNRIVRGRMRVDREPCDVHAIARDAVETLRGDAGAKGHALEVELEATLHHVSADPLRLRQVLMNLLKNAIKFTPAGGTLRVGSWNGTDSVAVEVADNGIGIEPAHLPQLFEPFTQEETSVAGGLGLGLAIAKGLIALHDGRIQAQSRGIGKGSRFVIELPLLDPAAVYEERPPAQSSSRPPPRQGTEQPRILLVEDHVDTASVLRELLQSNGYEVETAASLEEARQVDLAKVDLIVSDLGLPDGTGLELMRELRLRAQLPAIALSGFGMQSDLKASREAGFDLHLTKPVNIELLLEAIHRLSPTLHEQATPKDGRAPSPDSAG
jgi:signal transduction histidine kinase/ActR/RegA family two-component response regulator